MDLRNFIDTLSAQLATHEKKSHLAWWNLSTTGDSRYQQEIVSAQQALRTLTSSKEELNFLQEATTEDPLLERQRQILLLSYRENQIDPALIATIVEKEAKVEEIYTNFRPQVKGEHLSNNAIKNILKTSDDTTYRQQAWEASKEIGKQVSENVLELVHLRNQAAEQAGFTNYYSMQLELQEINEEDLFLLLNTLQQESTPLWRSYKNTLDKTLSTRFGKELYPWHYYDPFFQ
ncbi:MAG: M2 family metallopeptidase, partial [Chlamydiia bacterium]|nr:M2 family metallopeptidase [Chlamydiia bacterium]